jgi:hypothetical protein
MRDSNFFTFLERYADGDITRTFPDRHDRVFLAYLDYLRGFSPKRFIVLDIKYNTMHFLMRPYNSNQHPYLFDLIRKYRLRVLNVTRKNYLRYVISLSKANASGKWHVTANTKGHMDGQVYVEAAHLLKRLAHCDWEDRMIHDYFKSNTRYLSWEYHEMFPDATGLVAPALLQSITTLLGVSNGFATQPLYKKQSRLPLHETIENFDEIVMTLKGTQFEYCLDDEPSYESGRYV